ncbi:MAG: glycoside hydrolase family 99-like domain-containing protein [Clostridia bacterium]|nr:glycoside hydrolase family 99-like domain-containing protein [Clostridia bacterium]
MRNYDIAAFIWPSYTGDEPRTRIFWPEGYGEWQTVKAMTNRGYEGCRWPRIPTWGYVNEADSRVMEMQINCAVSYGVNIFIYDWYWYDNRPFLENCLNDGFLKARNNTQMKFMLMWANHNATHLWDKRNSDTDLSTVIWSGVVTPEIFSEICDRTIEKYFKRENYYMIDGCPVYMVFDVDNFIRTFGTTQECKKGLEEFRRKTVEAGFKGLHFQAVNWKGHTYNWLKDGDDCKGMTVYELYDYLGFDSVTNYNWFSCVDPDGDYAQQTDAYIENLEEETKLMNVPFYPNISVGWDNNVRFNKFMPGVVKNNTPENFRIACEKVKKFADESIEKGVMKAPFITVNSWNEWTETSYLQPDDLYGYGYLEAIKEVFTGE